MNKEQSLAFLQSCIEKVKKATDQEIQFYKEIYDRECVPLEQESEFEFVFPSKDIKDKYEINEEFELDICNQDMQNDKSQMQYNFLGSDSFSQDANSNLPYAA